MVARSLAATLLASLALGEVPSHFSGQLRCPFAKVWLEHGAERAAEILGVEPHRRLQQPEQTVWGKCVYRNNFANSDVCVELVGDSWDGSAAKTSCDGMMTAGTLTEGGSCDTTGQFAGWCSTNGGKLRASNILTAGQDCAAMEDACKTWSSGTWIAEGECSGGSGDDGSPSSGSVQLTSDGKCGIAPGAMGAAHQMASSPGYSNDCPGSPAQQSKYMWPLRWSAHVDSKGLAFGSDVPTYESRGKVSYMLDRNWKRLDNWYQVGTQRGVGQGPCQQPGDDPFSCIRNETRNTTVLHRGSKMTFIDYFDDGSISSCRWMDLGPVGNIRPDWFMDKRGDSTDVQYLGDVHVYYQGEPKLVKQWRKKDFANQYFTMSMQGNPGADNVHWPLILNVPGEGFGDDFLQTYSNHQMIDENDAAQFLIDDAFVAAGGSCPMAGGDGEGSSGPPTGMAEHVPSNLEVEKASWRSIEYTLSPIWTPKTDSCSAQVSSGNGMMRITDEVSVQACWDFAENVLSMTALMKMETQAWAAISFRETDECLMTPRGGTDAELVLAIPEAEGIGYSVHFGPLSPAMKEFDATAIGGFMGKMTPMSGMTDVMPGGSATYVNGELHFSFARKYATKPETFYLNYGLGSSAKIAYHKSRGCFELKDVPACLPQWKESVDSSADDQPDLSGSGRLLKEVGSGGAMLTAFGMGAMLR